MGQLLSSQVPHPAESEEITRFGSSCNWKHTFTCVRSNAPRKTKEVSSVKLAIKPKASLMISKDVLKEVPVNVGEKGVELVLLQDAGPIPPLKVCQTFSFLQTEELETRYQC